MKYIIWVLLVSIMSLLYLPLEVASYEAPVEPVKPPIKEYAEKLVNDTFGGGWKEFETLIARESNWNSEAQNPNSSAFGYAQFLNSTWKTVGCVKTTDPYIQIDCAVKYVQARYTSPEKALVFHRKNNWY